MDTLSLESIRKNPLLLPILNFLVDDNKFTDTDIDQDVTVEMEHNGKTINWCKTEDSKPWAQLSLWSNTPDDCWVMYADLHVDVAAITIKLEFVPEPHRATDKQPRAFEETIHTEGGWERIRNEIIKPWLEYGLQLDEEAEQCVSDDDTDHDEPI